jgi:hypothetical protein
MARTDIAGLLTGIGSAPIDPMQGASIRDREIALQQQALGGFRKGVGALTGGRVDARSTTEKAQDALAQLDPTKKEDREKIIQIVSRVSPERVPAIRAEFARRDEQERVTALSEKREKEALDISRLQATRGSTSPYTFGRSYVVRDKDDNLYNVNASMSKQGGTMETIYSPITPGAPATPTGELIMVSGEFGQSFEDELKSGQQEQEYATFGEMRAGASDELAKSGEALVTGNRMLELLSQIETGGFTEVTKKAIFDTFGVTPTSISEFENLAGDMMLANLKAFGANPTEGERAVAASLQASIDKGEGVNKAIIERFIAEQKRKQARLEYLTLPSTKNLQSYNNYVKAQYSNKGKEKEVKEPTDVIDLSSLPVD